MGSERGDGYKKPSSLGEGTGTKVPDNSEAPQRATASRLVPTHQIDAAALPEGAKRRHGYSRDRRSDCPQVVIALVITPEGLPLAYEVLPGNTKDNQTLRQFLAKIEAQYGKAQRVWVMDRGIPTEEVLAEMRQSDPPVRYLVGTPKGRLTRLEKLLVDQPWQQARQGVQVKLLAQDGEFYVFAESAFPLIEAMSAMLAQQASLSLRSRRAGPRHRLGYARHRL